MCDCMYPLAHTEEGHKAKAHPDWKAPEIVSEAYQPTTKVGHVTTNVGQDETDFYEARFLPRCGNGYESLHYV